MSDAPSNSYYPGRSVRASLKRSDLGAGTHALKHYPGRSVRASLKPAGQQVRRPGLRTIPDVQSGPH